MDTYISSTQNAYHYMAYIYVRTYTVPLDINLSVARVHSASDLHVHSKARE